MFSVFRYTYMIPIHETSFSLTPLGNVQIGRYSSVGRDCDFLVEGTHLAEINYKCVFTTNWERPDSLPIVIGNDVWIGKGVKILGGVTIGDGAIVGAWSVVAKDVEPFSVVVGNPARVVRMRFTPEQIEKLNKIKWWEWDKSVAEERKEDLKDIDVFLEKYGN
jgi:acetyltransferase-like isoleucine patch superfamily enzyme